MCLRSRCYRTVRVAAATAAIQESVFWPIAVECDPAAVPVVQPHWSAGHAPGNDRLRELPGGSFRADRDEPPAGSACAPWRS